MGEKMKGTLTRYKEGVEFDLKQVKNIIEKIKL